jgi:glycine/D-amino acid oxidase-like deaminating enzyme
MDLRSGCQYWTQKQRDAPLRAPALDRDESARVVILGGGITGALAAHYLVGGGVEAVLVDRRDLAAGSTAASTGLLQYEIDKPLVELSERVGRAHAARAYRLGVGALDEFNRLTRELGDDCGFGRRRSLFLATTPASAELLRAEAAARREAGLRVEFMSESDVWRGYGIERPGAILSHDAAQVDPVRLTSALLRRSVGRGLRAFARTQIDRYETDGRTVTLTTQTGRRLRAEHVVFATGYETPEFLGDIPVRLTSALLRGSVGRGLRAFARTQIDRYETDGRTVTLTTQAGQRLRAEHVVFATGYETPEFLGDIPVRLKSTYALAARTGGDSTPGGADFPLIWETGTPYFYARADGADRLIAGGEDDDFADPTARDARIPQKVETLARKLARLLPGTHFEPDCAWAGTFAETEDSLPLIGPHPQFPRGLFALGYGGNGITFGLIAARILCDRILGRPNADAEIFRFDR